MSLGFRSFFCGLMLFYLGPIHEDESRLPSGANENYFFSFFIHINHYAFVKQKKQFTERLAQGCALSFYKQNQKQIVFFFLPYSYLCKVEQQWSFHLWQVRSFLPSVHPSFPLSCPDLSKELSEIVFMIVYPLSSVVSLSLCSIISTR